MSEKLDGIIKNWNKKSPTIIPEDIDWLIEQAEKYQRVRDKFIEQSIKENYGALKRLDD